jgi:amino acid permease
LGLIGGPLALIIAAAMSEFSVYILVSAARRSGANSYVEVAYAAFGYKARVFTLILVLLITLMSCVAYTILIRDLMPAVVHFFFSLGDPDDATDQQYVMIATICLIAPVTFMRTLESLKFASVVSGCATLLLATAITIRSVQRNAAYEPIFSPPAPLYYNWFPETLGDALYAMPVCVVAFVCHFNVLPVHQELKMPTRGRMTRLLHGVFGSVLLLYIVCGVFGYLYAANGVQGNIMLDFDASDTLMIFGRLGIGMTVILSYPMLVLPAKHTLAGCIEELMRGCSEKKVLRSGEEGQGSSSHNGSGLGNSLLEEGHRTSVNSRSDNGYESDSSDSSGESNRLRMTQQPSGLVGDFANARSPMFSPYALLSRGAPSEVRLIDSPVANVLLTLVTVGITLAAALLIPSIIVVWNISGSTVSIILAFILPSALYLKIRARKKRSKVKFLARIMLGVSVVMLIMCTTQAVVSIMNGTMQ